MPVVAVAAAGRPIREVLVVAVVAVPVPEQRIIQLPQELQIPVVAAAVAITVAAVTEGTEALAVPVSS